MSLQNHNKENIIIEYYGRRKKAEGKFLKSSKIMLLKGYSIESKYFNSHLPTKLVDLILGILILIYLFSNSGHYDEGLLFLSLSSVFLIPMRLLLPDGNLVVSYRHEGNLKECPFCKERIKKESTRCRYCHGDL